MISLSLALVLTGAAFPAAHESATASSQPQDASKQSTKDDFDFEYVEEGEFDPASVPVVDGIVWYGTWEDAMAEKERTGKPVMLHMGSPRCPTTCVPGTW